MRTPPISTPLEDGIVYPVRTAEDRAAFDDWFSSQRLVAVDTETTGVAFHAEVRLLQLSDAREAWVLEPSKAMDVVTELVFGDKLLIAHNASFDALMLARLLCSDGEELAKAVMSFMSRFYDTYIAAHLIDPRGAQEGGWSHSLKDQCKVHLGEGSIDPQSALKARFKEMGLSMSRGFAEIPLWDEVYVRYSGVDPLLTFRLHEKFQVLHDSESFDNLFNFETEVAAICAAMTARGIQVDVDWARKTLQELEAEKLAAEREASIYGIENVNSGAQVAEALLVAGIELTERTNSGNAWKVDNEILNGINHPIASCVQTAKSANKAAESWVKPIIAQAEAGSGRVHARIRTLGARTGRMSVADPALQQLPTDDFRIRRCLVAGKGRDIVLADFAQMEVRAMGYLADDDRLLADLLSGVDVHSAVAARLFGENFTAENRATSKGAVFCKLYGGSAKKLAAQAGVTELEAKKAMAALDRSYPRMSRWSSRLIDRARFNGGHITTPSGRVLPVDRGYEYRLVNHIVQSTSADLFKGALIGVSKAGFNQNLLLPVHDELVCVANREEAEELGREIAELMSDQLGQVPLVAEAKVAGPSWGHAYQMEFVNA
jgi:DNA polymerase-1